MKKQVLTLGTVILFAFGSATFIGCGNAENHGNENMEHMGGEHHEETMEHDDEEMMDDAEEMHEEHAMYQCPMKCEGDKTYEEPGKCPKCEMDLKEVE